MNEVKFSNLNMRFLKFFEKQHFLSFCSLLGLLLVTDSAYIYVIETLDSGFRSVSFKPGGSFCTKYIYIYTHIHTPLTFFLVFT